jgi:uncharacterized Zn finger protein
MSGVLNDGGPIVVTTPRDRIGHGPWARLFVTAVVGSEGSAVAERGRALARGGNVHAASVAEGRLAARVVGSDGEEYGVTFTAEPVAARIWRVVAQSGRHNERLRAAIAGREQSVHLDHLMRFDWSSPLVPSAPACACTCAQAGVCEHVAGFAYVVADLIDTDPSLLLRWRGCDEASADARERAEQPPAPEAPVVSNEDDWQLGPLPAQRVLRPLPVGAVLTCLGESSLATGGGDLRDALQKAYASFSQT